jgi:hypothetical protein
LGTRFESLNGSVSAAQAGWARGTALSFSGSTLTVKLPGEHARAGTYRVVSNNDGVIELSVLGHDGHEDRTHLTLETERLLRWHLGEVHTVVMRRP